MKYPDIIGSSDKKFRNYSYGKRPGKKLVKYSPTKAKINKLKGKLESKKGTLLCIQNSKIPTGSLDLVKPSVPNYAPANLTDAENSLSMIDEALTFAEGANAVFEENVVGVRARVSSVILNLKDF